MGIAERTQTPQPAPCWLLGTEGATPCLPLETHRAERKRHMKQLITQIPDCLEGTVQGAMEHQNGAPPNFGGQYRLLWMNRKQAGVLISLLTQVIVCV